MTRCVASYCHAKFLVDGPSTFDDAFRAQQMAKALGTSATRSHPVPSDERPQKHEEGIPPATGGQQRSAGKGAQRQTEEEGSGAGMEVDQQSGQQQQQTGERGEGIPSAPPGQQPSPRQQSQQGQQETGERGEGTPPAPADQQQQSQQQQPRRSRRQRTRGPARELTASGGGGQGIGPGGRQICQRFWPRPGRYRHS